MNLKLLLITWQSYVKIFLILLICFSNEIMLAQEKPLCGARSAGMGDIICPMTGFLSIFGNQAGVSEVNVITAGISFKNKFFLKETSTIALGVVFPIHKVGVIALKAERFGFSLYHNTNLSLSVIRRFYKNFSVALQFDYMNIGFGNNYGFHNIFTFEVGFQYEILKKLIIGVHIYNPIRVKFDKYSNERIESCYRIGIGYIPIKKILAALEFEKNTNSKGVNIKGGIEYKIISQFAVRLGIQSQNPDYSFGMSLILKKISLDISASFHQILGMTSQLSFSYGFKK